jgi:hypothetical protein
MLVSTPFEARTVNSLTVVSVSAGRFDDGRSIRAPDLPSCGVSKKHYGEPPTPIEECAQAAHSSCAS